MPPPPKEHIIISNGEKVHVNDHVYVSPPWELRDGIPYSIARIMEFLPDEGQSFKDDSAKGKGKERQGITRVRLAWYYRPSDLSDRAVADSRLLYAAIFSEVQPVKFLRAKCHVRHKDKIVDLNGWKRRPDRFYFSKLFDPYIKKEYEVIRSVDVNNLPPQIKNTLQARYEFVITEREMVSDLTDNIRLCGTCEQWCPAPESVQCDLCKNFFHMQCVSPPLAGKPSKGYGWTCAPCTLQHEETVDRKLPRNAEANKSKATTAKGKGKQSNASGTRVVHTEDKYFKMWPYRYFGLYTVAEDTLDPDDMIFPRSTTRVGPRYQSWLPQFVGGPAPSEVSPSGDDNLPNRGGEDTIEVMSSVVHWSEADVQRMELLKSKLWMKPEQRFSLEYLEEAIRRFTAAHDTNTDLDSVKLRNSIRPRKWQKSEVRFVDKDWTPEEIQIFEKGLDAYGAELFSIKGDLKGRSTAEVVRFYGKWKNTRLGEENRKAQSLPPPPPPTKFRRTVAVRSSSDPDDEGSVVNGQLENTKESLIMCGSCKTKDSTVWWKAPRGLISSIMCDTCGIAWRKYGDIKGPSKQDDHPPQNKKQQAAAAAAATAAEKDKSEKRDSTPLPLPPPKRQKQMPPPNKYGACACCRKVGLAGTVVKCEDCGLVVHVSCYGVGKADASVEPWLCEVCANEKHQEFSLVSNCLLCPRPPFAQAPPPAKGSSGEFLRAWKPTEGRGWVHAICSVFIPEVAFTDASRLRMVEGMSSLPKWRWTDECSFCQQTGGGAVVKCPDCPVKFHLSCAWRNQLRFGFELTPKKTWKQGEPPLVTFRGVQGVLEPFVWCNAHILEQKRIVWGPCDASEGETALQIYCKTYKQVPLEHSYGLLRRAYRLDQALNLDKQPESVVSDAQIPRKECTKCKINTSPFFWPIEDNGLQQQNGVIRKYLCNRCKMTTDGSGDIIMNGTEGSLPASSSVANMRNGVGTQPRQNRNPLNRMGGMKSSSSPSQAVPSPLPVS